MSLEVHADPPPARGRTRSGTVLPAVATVAAAGALGFVLWRLDWSSVAGLGALHAWVLLLAAGLLQLATLPLKSVGWQITLGAVDERGTPPLRTVLPPVAVGALLNLALAGRVGDAARLGLVHARLVRSGRPSPPEAVVGSAVVETTVSTVAWVGLVAAAGMLMPLPGIAWAVIAVAALAAAAVLLAAARGWWTGGGSAPSGLIGRLAGAVRCGWRGIAAGHRSLARASVLLPLAAVSVAGWLAQWASVWAVLAAFDVGGGWQTPTLVLIAVSVAQTLPVVPGNIGIFQAATALPLVAVAGVDAGTAVAIGVVLQVVQTAPVALAGAVAAARAGGDVGELWRRIPRFRSPAPDPVP